MEERRASFRTIIEWPVTIITSKGSTEGETKDVSGSSTFSSYEDKGILSVFRNNGI